MPDVNAYKHYKPEHQAKLLSMLKEKDNEDYRPFYCPDFRCDGNHHIEHEGPELCVKGPHRWGLEGTVWLCKTCKIMGLPKDEWLWTHARRDQRPPKWSAEWFVWLLSGGRGSGKTRTGAEVIIRATHFTPRISLISPTGPDLRITMIEGDSGILASAPPDQRPLWEPSKKQLTFPNGAIAQGFSGEEPDRLRGPQGGLAWLDEPAHYDDIEMLWENLLYGMRLGENPKIVCTTTPRPTKWMKKLIADPYTITRRVSSYANLANLAPSYMRTVLEPRENTRLGRQEIHGEMLEDVEGSLWKWEMFRWLHPAPELIRIVVSVDPAGTANTKSDETGIVVVGVDEFQNIYVLGDYTGKYSPGGWAAKANWAYESFSADAIVAEKNYGGDMVKHTLETSGFKGARIILVNSRRGKQLRAEPVVALYEKQQVIHVGQQGDLLLLETEMTDWVPGKGASPNRIDALVHGATELRKEIVPSAIAGPNQIRQRHLFAI